MARHTITSTRKALKKGKKKRIKKLITKKTQFNE